VTAWFRSPVRREALSGEKHLGPRRGSPSPSIINEKTIADFTRVVEQTGILDGEPIANEKPGWKAGLIASIS
jgi:hypothetical protein